MQSEHDVLVSIDPQFAKHVTPDWLVGIARITLEMEHVGKCQLGIVITDDTQVRALNKQFADDDHATDVLSFSLREGEEFVTPDAMDRLGEVIISFETADRQATEAGHHTEDELAHLLVHGVLHLLGYDHIEPADETKMRARERSVLSGLGIEAH